MLRLPLINLNTQSRLAKCLRGDIFVDKPVELYTTTHVEELIIFKYQPLVLLGYPDEQEPKTTASVGSFSENTSVYKHRDMFRY